MMMRTANGMVHDLRQLGANVQSVTKDSVRFTWRCHTLEARSGLRHMVKPGDTTTKTPWKIIADFHKDYTLRFRSFSTLTCWIDGIYNEGDLRDFRYMKDSYWDAQG